MISNPADTAAWYSPHYVCKDEEHDDASQSSMSFLHNPLIACALLTRLYKNKGNGETDAPTDGQACSFLHPPSDSDATKCPS